MPILRVYAVLALLGLLGGGLPRQVVPAHLYIVVRELAQLVVVHAQELGLFRGAELEPRDEVDDEGEDGGYDKGVCCAGYDVRHLDVQLLVVVIDPPSVNDARVDAVQADDIIGSKEGVEDEADDSSNT